MAKLRQFFGLLAAFFFITSGVVYAQSPAAGDTLLVVGKIRLHGNERTKDYIITRELPFHSGDTLGIRRLQELRDKAMWQVFNLRLFTSVYIELQAQDGSGLTHVDIFLKERWYFFAIPIAEIADRNFNVWWEEKNHDLNRLNYGARATMFNLRGRNETMRVSLQAGFTRKFSVDYFFPYINKKLTIGANLNFTYSDNKEIWFSTDSNKLQTYHSPDKILYRRVKSAIGFTYRRKIYTVHSLDFEYNGLQIADTVAGEFNSNYFLNGSTRQYSLYTEYKYTYDKRNSPAYPLKGAYLEATAGGFYFFGPEKPIGQGRLNAALYRALGGRHYINVGFSGKVSGPGRQPYNIYKAFGYGYYVRGFEYYVVDGQHYVLGRTNYVINILKQKQFYINSSKFKKFATIPLAVYAKLFYDGGYVYDAFAKPTNNYSNSYLAGYGAGIDFVTYYDRILRAEYSFNNKGQSGLFLHYVALF